MRAYRPTEPKVEEKAELMVPTSIRTQLLTVSNPPEIAYKIGTAAMIPLKCRIAMKTAVISKTIKKGKGTKLSVARVELPPVLMVVVPVSEVVVAIVSQVRLATL